MILPTDTYFDLDSTRRSLRSITRGIRLGPIRDFIRKDFYLSEEGYQGAAKEAPRDWYIVIHEETPGIIEGERGAGKTAMFSKLIEMLGRHEDVKITRTAVLDDEPFLHGWWNIVGETEATTHHFFNRGHEAVLGLLPQYEKHLSMHIDVMIIENEMEELKRNTDQLIRCISGELMHVDFIWHPLAAQTQIAPRQTKALPAPNTRDSRWSLKTKLALFYSGASIIAVTVAGIGIQSLLSWKLIGTGMIEPQAATIAALGGIGLLLELALGWRADRRPG